MKRNLSVQLFALLLAAGVSAAASGAAPSVSGVTLARNAETMETEITYTLSGAPAIVTLGIRIGDETVPGSKIVNLKGMANTLVETNGTYTVRWATDIDLGSVLADSAQAVVRAWPLEEPPDYMVVDLIREKRVRYYPTVDDLPRGLFGTVDYRTTKLVMRRIHAKNVTWTMGSLGETGRSQTSEAIHPVTMPADYWMGVFEVTQAQWAQVRSGDRPAGLYQDADWAMRPVEMVSFAVIRESADYTSNPAYYYPADPCPDSFLGLLRTKSGLKFDLPGEAAWEFACRAGYGEGTFNNGWQYDNIYGFDRFRDPKYSGVFPGRVYHPTSGYPIGGGPITSGIQNYRITDGGTAAVGMYEPSRWGLYDMHGNVSEWCLDWYAEDITGLDGAINADGAKYADGTTPAEELRVARGGAFSFEAQYCRAASRNKAKNAMAPQFDRKYSSGYEYNRYAHCLVGLRVTCPLVSADDLKKEVAE